jgi:ring-1,2-phenylacetyl-CoA epoxidase subunit PaaB
LNSLDPRVSRLPQIGIEGKVNPKIPLDQFGTYEVFVQPKEGKPFQHEGIVHAPNLEMAYILGKETFTRRFTCVSLYVVDTRDVFVSPLTEGDTNVYDQITTPIFLSKEKEQCEIYHLPKRGKQHIHAGTLMASSAEEALYEAKQKFNQGKIIYNVWAIASSKIRYTSKEEQELWITLPDKKFRDAAEYKGGDKLKGFLESRQ